MTLSAGQVDFVCRVSVDAGKVLGDVVCESHGPSSAEEGQDIFIRYNEAIPILRKIMQCGEQSFSDIVSANDPFGFDVREKDSYKRIKPEFSLENNTSENCQFYYNGWRKSGIGYVSKESVRKNNDWIDKFKVLVPKAWGVGDPGRDRVSPFIVEPNSCNTETYLVIGPFENKNLAENGQINRLA